MEAKSIATQPSNSPPPSQRGIEIHPALDAAFLIIVSLVILSAILFQRGYTNAASIYAYIPKRRQHSFSFKPRHKVSCRRCRYFSSNAYLNYIEKILARFKGEVVLNVEIDRIFRSPDAVKIVRSNGEIQEFDKVVFATPPDQVMVLLADPTDAETKRFSAWKANYATTLLHRDTSMYTRYGIRKPSEFDFFQTNSRWGYNSCLNQLCGISSSQHYFLSFQLKELIARDRVIDIQEHHTPLYTTESFRYRDEVVATNGENNTYHAGAYLGDGLHEGAIASAFRVAQLIGSSLDSIRMALSLGSSSLASNGGDHDVTSFKAE